MLLKLARTFVVVMALAAPAAAQTPAVQPGQKVRVRVPLAVSSRPLVGTVAASTPQSLTLSEAGRRDSSTVVLPWDQVTGLEVSRGSLAGGTGTGKSVQRGVLIGGATAAVLALAFRVALNAGYNDPATHRAGEFMLKGLAVGVPVGAIAGVFVASGTREDWTPVPLPALGFTPRAGTRVALAVHF